MQTYWTENSIKGGVMFTNDTYDKVKWIAQILLPGIGTLWFTISSIWGFPFGEQILGTITALDLFLGGLLGLSSNSYNGDGTMVIDKSDPQKDIYRMEFNDDLDSLSDKESVTFKIVNGKGE